MSEKLSVATYIETLKKGGPDKGFELVQNTFGRQIEVYIYKQLSRRRYKDWGKCDDPANHKSGVRQNTFLKFLVFNNKFYESEYTKVLRDISGLLYRISRHKVYEHMTSRQCKDLPPNLTVNVGDIGYQLPDGQGGRDPEKNLIFKDALESLPIKNQEALKDYCDGFSHEEVSKKRNISVDASKKRRWDAIRRFRQFHGIG